MAEKTIKTRISHLVKTLEEWNSTETILNNGEIAFALIETTDSTRPDGTSEAPQVLFKIGDGKKKFSELNFVSGLSADVYSWAKGATKPAYTASEITGLSDYIAGEIEDTDTQYQIVVDSTNTDIKKIVYELQSKVKGGSWAKVGSFDVPTGDGINALINSAITALDLSNTYDAKGSAKAVQDNFDAYKVSNDEAVADVKTTADAAKSTIDAFMKEAVKDGDSEQVIDTLKEIQDFIDSDKTATSELVAKSHEHTNKAELDKIESGDKTKWDEAATKASTALQSDSITNLATKDEVNTLSQRITTESANYATAAQGKLADTALQPDDVLILQCTL